MRQHALPHPGLRRRESDDSNASGRGERDDAQAMPPAAAIARHIPALMGEVTVDAEARYGMARKAA